MLYFGLNHFSFNLKVIWSLKYLNHHCIIFFFSFKIQGFSSCPPCACSFWSLFLVRITQTECVLSDPYKICTWKHLIFSLFLTASYCQIVILPWETDPFRCVGLFCSQMASSQYVAAILICPKCITLCLVIAHHLLSIFPGPKLMYFCLYDVPFLWTEKALVKDAILSTSQSSAAWETVPGSWCSGRLHSPKANCRNYTCINLQKHMAVQFFWRFNTVFKVWNSY